MTQHALRVDRLSKRYLLGEEHTDLLSERLSNLLRGRRSKRERRELWALRDVSFEVPQGEVLGVIGRNGAGKSTLLKVLSRITAPTDGRAVVRGRLASLLEVGTGFHPELTGRENIYLNGTILGMKKREIDRKFNDIVAFSEVEMFLDTPVKRYSSGMYVRLAFAVAAHLDPDVLVVDEVLAVGDREFQNKCLGRLESMARTGGPTVLLVSHNLDSIRRLCSRAIVLRDGRLDFDGHVGAAVDHYIRFGNERSEAFTLASRRDREGMGSIVAANFAVADEAGSHPPSLMSGGNYRFDVTLHRTDPTFRATAINLAIEVRDTRDITVWLVYTAFSNVSFAFDGNEAVVACRISDLNLAPGEYSVTLFVAKGTHDVLDIIHNAARLTVAGGDFFGTGSSGMPEQCRTLTRAEWSLLS